MKRTLTLGISLAALALAGCQTVAAPGDAEVVICEAFRPITYSRNDTQETRDQVTEYNAMLAEACGQ
jgi:hypothetical protein